MSATDTGVAERKWRISIVATGIVMFLVGWAATSWFSETSQNVDVAKRDANQQLHQMAQTITSLKQSVLLMTLRTNDNDSAAQAEIIERLAQMDQSVSGLRSSIAQVGHDKDFVQESIDRAVASMADANQRQFDVIRTNLAALVAQGVGPSLTSSEVSARQSEAAMQAAQSGDQLQHFGSNELAMVYYVNSLNHDPGRIETVKAIAELALNSSDSTLLTRAQGILELSAYQVPASDVEPVLMWIEAIQKRLVPKDAESPTLAQLKNRYARISLNCKADAIWTNSTFVAEGIASVQSLIDDVDAIDSQGTDNAELSGMLIQAERLDANLKAVQDIALLREALENTLLSLKEEGEKSKPSPATGESILMAANGILSQLWCKDMSVLPPRAMDWIHSRPQSIDELTQVIRKKASLESYESARRLIDDTLHIDGPKYTRAISLVQSNIMEIQKLSGSVTFEEYRNDLARGYSDVNEHLAKLGKRRYQSYQEWALSCCSQFMNKWDANKTVNNKEAKRWFEDYQLPSIDQGLLSPEVTRIFGHVTGLIFSELPGKEAYTIERTLAETDKKELEDF